MPEPITVFILVASGACLALQLLVVYLETRRLHAFDRRLAVSREQIRATEPRSAAGADLRSSLRKGGFAFVRAGSMLVPIGPAEREKLSALLRRAGFGRHDALPVFLSVKLAVAAGVGALAGFGASRTELLGSNGFLVAFAVLAGLVVGSLLPEYAVRFLGNRRVGRMSASLPDALDLMVMCLESGLTFERALITVAEEMTPIEPALANEFRLVEAELRLGSSRRDVLLDFERRTEVEGLRDLARTFVQSERYGTPLTQSIRNIAANERLQRAMRTAAPRRAPAGADDPADDAVRGAGGRCCWWPVPPSSSRPTR